MKKRKFISHQELHEEWMKDSEYQKEYENLDLEFQVAREIIEARVNRKISQEELAKRMGTGQAVISRLENANAKPSLSLVKRLAAALDLKVELHFKPR